MRLSYSESNLVGGAPVTGWRRTAETGGSETVRITTSLSTVTRHVTGTPTDTTDDVGSVVSLLWTVVFAVTDVAAILAHLVFVVA